MTRRLPVTLIHTGTSRLKLLARHQRVSAGTRATASGDLMIDGIENGFSIEIEMKKHSCGLLMVFLFTSAQDIHKYQRESVHKWNIKSTRLGKFSKCTTLQR